MTTIKNFAAQINPITTIKTRRYENMIAASQAKLAETTHVPGYTKIYC